MGLNISSGGVLLLKLSRPGEAGSNSASLQMSDALGNVTFVARQRGAVRGLRRRLDRRERPRGRRLGGAPSHPAAFAAVFAAMAVVAVAGRGGGDPAAAGTGVTAAGSNRARAQGAAVRGALPCHPNHPPPVVPDVTWVPPRGEPVTRPGAAARRTGRLTRLPIAEPADGDRDYHHQRHQQPSPVPGLPGPGPLGYREQAAGLAAGGHGPRTSRRSRRTSSPSRRRAPARRRSRSPSPRGCCTTTSCSR